MCHVTPATYKEITVVLPPDPSPELADYAVPERLVTTQWLADNLGAPGLALVESNEDVLLYETGHIPGAIKVDWHTELNDPVMRDYIDGEGFAALMSRKGISRDDTVVIYGDKSNWWAAYALWVFTLFGHPDVRLLNGGRDAWIAQGREITKDLPSRSTTQYPVVERRDDAIRAFKEDVLTHWGNPLIDVRSPEEYSGERTHMPAYPEEGALRGGHIPTARSIPWARAAQEDGTFKPHRELVELYFTDADVSPSDNVITYCRIGERSSHTWFVLKYLLGVDNVRNYDGSWTEWGSAVRVPIATGTEPGVAP
jgi:thiosulfate/3-mercaptopyruvate sulfurtransferase